MPGDVNYAFEKYWAALSTLAEGQGTLPERLIDAYVSQGGRVYPLVLGMGPPVSEELAERIEALHHRLTAVAGGVEGAIAATVRQFDAEELDSAVRELVSITLGLASEYFTAHAAD
ncbi:MAG: hypothetical protein KY443_03250 [Actinobacteria bacterium]|nr:hypothetical protein [Actinomycetota bacterium]